MTKGCDICSLVQAKCTARCSFRQIPGRHYSIVQRFCTRKKLGKMLEDVSPQNRYEVFRSLLGEARCRKRDPVRGCYGRLEDSKERVNDLHRELNAMERESNTVKRVYYLQCKAEQENGQAAVDSYTSALGAAEDLPVVHPTRLGLALNAASFYDGRSDRVRAREIVQEAIAAVGDLEVVCGTFVPIEVSTLMGFLKAKFVELNQL